MWKKIQENMPSVGLILEGGGNRGVFTAGILDYLMEKEIYFPYVAGVSAGACNAVDYIARQPGRTFKTFLPYKASPTEQVWTLFHEHSLMDMEKIFNTYAYETYPFDFDTYFTSPIQADLVVTNCITGKAEYMDNREDRDELLKILRASCSLPLISPAVELQGMPYMDGGIADSIPVRRAMSRGYKKNVIILTRREGYQKSRNKLAEKAVIGIYRKYPYMIRKMHMRSYIYNRTLKEVERLEAAGKVFVLRPEMPEVKRLGNTEADLQAFYQHGYDLMAEAFPRLMAFLAEQ